jgi:hypothetical protein
VDFSFVEEIERQMSKMQNCLDDFRRLSFNTKEEAYLVATYRPYMNYFH